ncbi:Benzyl alcohol O-benzoyltransferase [Linum grandiflorum]
MAGPTKTKLIFTVRRSQAEVVRPAKPTPSETKPLSDIDDQVGLRFHIPVIHFYKHQPSMLGKDPVSIIRKAVAEALVHYYPLAGRLREFGSKLAVDCTGEGVLFIEADADVRLADFGDGLFEMIRPPFACVEELLFDVPGSSDVLDSPLMLIQVTRLRCGGFIFAIRILHCMSDALGLVQFLSAVAEITRGATTPSVAPVWERHILTRPHQNVSHTHHDQPPAPPSDFHHIAQRSFFFGPTEISALRHHHCRRYSRFEIVAACLWKCRTAALQPAAEEEMRMLCVVNARGKLVNPPLPGGYYGNAMAFPAVTARAGELCRNPLGYALDLARKAKSAHHMNSVADMALFAMTSKWTFMVSDVTWAGFSSVDFGWGEAVYAGPGEANVGPIGGVANFCVPGKNKEGEDGIVLAISLPAEAMERFEQELESLFKGALETRIKDHYIRSAL